MIARAALLFGVLNAIGCAAGWRLGAPERIKFEDKVCAIEGSCKLDSKVRLFLTWYRAHPAPFQLVEALATNGAGIVPVAVDRLARSNDDFERTALLEVLAELHDRGLVDPAASADVVRVSEDAYERITASRWEWRAANALATIRREPGVR